tara:strand:+ start:1688 stop:2287 length:600 start_codon:yes stop_codon:yes gene_type:complete
VKKKVKNKNLIFLVLFMFFQTCSTSDVSKGVLSKEDLSSEIVVTTIQEVSNDNETSTEDVELLLARCLRDKGYDVEDPKNDEGLRSVLVPIFQLLNEREREELFQIIQLCAEENNIPLGNNGDFQNPDDIAERLDTELEFAQCLREKGIEVEDPSAERPLRPILVGLVQSGQYLEKQVREAAGECFDDLGIEQPQRGGG